MNWKASLYLLLILTIGIEMVLFMTKPSSFEVTKTKSALKALVENPNIFRQNISGLQDKDLEAFSKRIDAQLNDGECVVFLNDVVDGADAKYYQTRLVLTKKVAPRFLFIRDAKSKEDNVSALEKFSCKKIAYFKRPDVIKSLTGVSAESALLEFKSSVFEVVNGNN